MLKHSLATPQLWVSRRHSSTSEIISTQKSWSKQEEPQRVSVTITQNFSISNWNSIAICCYTTTAITNQLMHALVSSLIDYCNSFLLVLPVTHLNQLQLVPNVSACLTCICHRNDHVMPLLWGELHWLQVTKWIFFCMCRRLSKGWQSFPSISLYLYGAP